LATSPAQKSGLVVPTAGGKTRIALRVGLQVLADSPEDDTIVIWVTHRKRLRRQAHRALQRLIKEGTEVPEGASELFARIHFEMIHDLPTELARFGDRVVLVIVDEAHHAAAPSYKPLFEDDPAHRGLFLTATPNRLDGLPIGIDEIAFTVTYRELFERGCIVEPQFDQPLILAGLDWSEPAGLHDLADYVLDRTDGDLNKVLVTVSRRGRVETLYRALMDLHDGRSGHPLDADDISYCHGLGTNSQLKPDELLDEFAARPAGVLVATSQLLGEGFDDPGIDGVIVTYPSESINHLMQLAGRALRSAPGKRRAHVVQVRESSLEYHFEQRWLYQDISDRLRPELLDREYSSAQDLRSSVESLLLEHRVSEPVASRVLAGIDRTPHGASVKLMLTGLPFYGDRDRFASEAAWGATLASDAERKRFVKVFNSISDLDADIRDPQMFLTRHIDRSPAPGSLWRS
jgi:superfamily II DNA or RNA helicase